ncbi:MAG TPA: hypothetical protein VM287_02935 [Egibacteraceae bacterium]|nr:hypothetical protein [Egibacteraceae bacterium]
MAAFLTMGWRSPNVRSTLADLDRNLTGALYFGVALLLAWSVFSAVLARFGRSPRLRRRPPAVLAGPAGLLASMLIYCVPAFAAWSSGAWWAMIGGAVPFGDAQLYFGGAERLLFFGELDVFNSRRPLNAMFLAVRLAVTQLDLRLALLIQCLLLGAACYVAARAVARDLGWLAGSALFVGLFGFSRLYTPTTMSEVLGITFGALAFAAIWTAAGDRKRWVALGGVFLLTLALDARSGAVLLALIVPLWFARRLRTAGWLDWPLLGAMAVTVLVGVGANYVAVSALGGDTSNTNANGGFLIYALANGHPSWDATNNWAEIYRDRPEVVAMTDPERNRFVSSMARAELREHPVRFLTTAADSMRNYLVISKRAILERFPIRQHRPIMAAAVVAIAVAVLRRRQWRSVPTDLALFGSMLLAIPALVSLVPGNVPPRHLGLALALLGFLAFLVLGSGPIRVAPQISLTLISFATIAACLPLLGVDTVRVFAATAPFLALPLALAVGTLVRHCSLATAASVPVEAAPVHGSSRGRLPLAVGGALAASLALGTPLAMAAVRMPPVASAMCADGRPSQALIGGVAVRVVADPVKKRAVDQVGLSAFARQAAFYTPVPSNHLAGISGPVTVIGGLSAAGTDRMAIVDADVGAPRRSVLQLCGQVLRDPLTDAVLAHYPQPVDIFRGWPLPSP